MATFTTSGMSLLDSLRKHSTIDLDCNDDMVALDFKPFQDMTSNQLIVLGQLKQPSAKKILENAVSRAKQQKDDFPGVEVADLAVDYATVLLGRLVAAHLHPTGYLHAQTLPSLANSTSDTVQHALRLVKLYEREKIPSSRVCIKIPSTPAGIAACKELESKHNVRTLATTCFTIAQALAAHEAGATYVAPYVNPLYVHLETHRHVKYEDPLKELRGMRATFAIQKELKRIGSKTTVLAASLVTPEECTALSGISHITLSSACLATLQSTPLDERYASIRDRSLAFLADTHETPVSNEDRPFLVEMDLEKALGNRDVAALQDNAIQSFQRAEEELREMLKALL